MYCYDEPNFSLFELLGKSQKRFRLSGSTRRMLGFLLVNSTNTLIDFLICKTYCSEISEKPKNVTIDDMLESLRRQPRGEYFGQTNNQIVSNIIHENAIEYHSIIDRQFESEQGRKALRRLLQQTTAINKEGSR